MADSAGFLQIGLLADHPEATVILQEWFKLKWEPYYGPVGLGDALEDLRNSCNDDELPVALVAIYEGQV